MRYLIPVLLLVTACSSAPRTKWSDPGLRVMLDPDSIDAANYVRVQHALVETGKFLVVDRSAGLRAIKKEQETIHQVDSDRYEDREKWAHWARLYSVASVIVAHVQCRREFSWWNTNNQKLDCLQNLEIVNANTGQVITSVEGRNSEPYSNDLTYIVPDWQDTVAKLVDSYPNDWEKQNYAGTVQTYQDLSKEESIRHQELRKSPNRAPAATLPGGEQ